MPATVTSITPRRAGGPERKPAPPRRPFRDNPRLILAGIGVLLAVLVALLAIANGTAQFSPDFLSEFVLYGLSAADLTMLAALVFVLARNIVKQIVERRKALPFARFRSKLVALLLGMTLVPAVLVLIVGSELIRTNIDRWFNAPISAEGAAVRALPLEARRAAAWDDARARRPRADRRQRADSHEHRSLVQRADLGGRRCRSRASARSSSRCCLG